MLKHRGKQIVCKALLVAAWMYFLGSLFHFVFRTSCVVSLYFLSSQHLLLFTCIASWRMLKWNRRLQRNVKGCYQNGNFCLTFYLLHLYGCSSVCFYFRFNVQSDVYMKVPYENVETLINYLFLYRTPNEISNSTYWNVNILLSSIPMYYTWKIKIKTCSYQSA